MYKCNFQLFGNANIWVRGDMERRTNRRMTKERYICIVYITCIYSMIPPNPMPLTPLIRSASILGQLLYRLTKNQGWRALADRLISAKGRSCSYSGLVFYQPERWLIDMQRRGFHYHMCIHTTQIRNHKLRNTKLKTTVQHKLAYLSGDLLTMKKAPDVILWNVLRSQISA